MLDFHASVFTDCRFVQESNRSIHAWINGVSEENEIVLALDERYSIFQTVETLILGSYRQRKSGSRYHAWNFTPVHFPFYDITYRSK